MPSPLVLVYLGDERRALDTVETLDQRTNRQIHLLTADVTGVAEVLEDERVDALVCGATLSEGDLQSVVFDVADHNDSVPIFDLNGDVAAVPERVSVHHVDPEVAPEDAVDRIVAAVTETDNGDTAPDVAGPAQYIAVDDDWNIREWDPRLTEWTELEPGETIGTSFWGVFESWEDQEFGDVCRLAMRTEESETATVFHESSRKWFDMFVRPGSTEGIECFLHEVTEHRDAGGAIEGTGARFEDTLDRMTDAFFALDNEERFVFLNSQAEFLLDVDASLVTGVRFWDAFPAAVSTTFYEEFQEAMETEEPTSFEEYYRPLDSWFEVNAYPSSDGLSVFLRDVTEQVQLQQKLEQLHDVTRELVVAESDSEIAAKTVEAAKSVLGFPMVSVWRHNSATGTLDPLAWSDEVGTRADGMNPLDEESEFIWEVYETGEPRVLGFVPATTNSSHHPGKVTSELLVRVGEFGVLGAYSDERDAFDETDVELFRILASTVESAFTRAERERQLARRNERLNDFASIVSHDLRNPLNVASSHVELARLSDDDEEHLGKIEESLLRMDDLIEDLLARARGDQDLDREPLSLAAVARDAWENVDTADATLKLDGDAGFDADPDRLQQLFENLFRNAIDHAGDDVTVRAGARDSGFYVADDGPGVPEERRNEIFDQGVTHSEEGTGYGLAIVTDIVEGHGWSIDVTESESGGARFEVSNIHSLAGVTEVT